MRPTSMWLRAAAYVALGSFGALWTTIARGTLFAAPESPLRLPSPWNLGVGLVLAVALAWLAVRATRASVRRSRWASRLHLHLRGALLGATSSQMVLLAGLSACSEELLFRAALAP